eukprot:gene5961-6655_t
MINNEQTSIIGTWYPTGFHGHFRSKSRQDFTVPYRQKAKPIPPSTFLNRASGLGKGKPRSGTKQHYKDTSQLLTWSADVQSRPSTSYRADFSSQPSWQQQSMINKSEPVHVRSNLGLRRRQINSQTCSPTKRVAPLLAWNDADYYTYAKPCVGTLADRRGVQQPKRLLSRSDNGFNTRSSMQRTCSNAGNESAVMETVTRLDL